MKHWDGRDRDQAVALRLPLRDRQRLAQKFEAPARGRREPQLASLVGLALAISVLASLAWLLSPAEVVSSAMKD